MCDPGCGTVQGICPYIEVFVSIRRTCVAAGPPPLLRPWSRVVMSKPRHGIGRICLLNEPRCIAVNRLLAGLAVTRRWRPRPRGAWRTFPADASMVVCWTASQVRPTRIANLNTRLSYLRFNLPDTP